MPFNVDKYRDEHESEEHWQLRKVFMEKWMDNFSEERLVCLARVFVNIELMGCRYPHEVMKEIAQLSKEVVNKYRDSRKDKLKRTFVAASDAAEDRAKGIRREGGIVVEKPPQKSARISFVPQGYTENTDNTKVEDIEDVPPDLDDDCVILENNDDQVKYKSITEVQKSSELLFINDYVSDMSSIDCMDVREFKEYMFNTKYGKLVFLIRPWGQKGSNILASCQACKASCTVEYVNNLYTIMINGVVVAQAYGETKMIAKEKAEDIAWNKLRHEMISIVYKEQWVAQGAHRVSAQDVTSRKPIGFGTPVEAGVAAKMMQMMGWKGGGLGAKEAGIAEPIQPQLQMVNKAGLGSNSFSQNDLRKATIDLMKRFLHSDSFDVDLVFSNEFTKEERALMHQCAVRLGLVSKSYGADKERFLVVRKKFDPFSLTKLIIEKGGSTQKYQVFIPMSLHSTHGR